MAPTSSPMIASSCASTVGAGDACRISPCFGMSRATRRWALTHHIGATPLHTIILHTVARQLNTTLATPDTRYPTLHCNPAIAFAAHSRALDVLRRDAQLREHSDLCSKWPLGGIAKSAFHTLSCSKDSQQLGVRWWPFAAVRCRVRAGTAVQLLRGRGEVLCHWLAPGGFLRSRDLQAAPTPQATSHAE